MFRLRQVNRFGVIWLTGEQIAQLRRRRTEMII
jgi:hypothetical protein